MLLRAAGIWVLGSDVRQTVIWPQMVSLRQGSVLSLASIATVLPERYRNLFAVRRVGCLPGCAARTRLICGAPEGKVE